MTERNKNPRSEVRCLNCFERFLPEAFAERGSCPKCKVEWRLSWLNADFPKIRGPVWDKLSTPGQAGEVGDNAQRRTA